ncbi:uncharacterized protein IAS62_003272 [Cryptococcus decagattii]|uniref:WSC domain-containing protein n=1 Tax=Cryptococcus decagattii TaxID=1859122 RepID=A0ABZ2ATW4_9TREE
MWWPEAASGRILGPTLALLLTALSFMPLEGLAQKTSTGDSEFIGCLDDSHKLLAGSHQLKKDTAKRSYYGCSAACVEAGAYPYSYFTDLGKGVQKCHCSSIGPRPSDYVVQPVGSFGCRLGQTRAALTQTDHHFIVCSSGFIGSFSRAGTYSSPLDCLDACGEDEGALFLPTYNGFSCRCGGVTSVKSVAACGAPDAEFSYVYKPAKKPKAFKSKASSGTGRKKLGKGSKNRLDLQEDVKKYDNPCDDPDSILGYCGFGEEDTPVFHDRTL